MAPIPKSKLAKRRGKQSSSKASPPRSVPSATSSPSPSQLRKRAATSEPTKTEEADTELVFDDPYGDAFETEEVVGGTSKKGGKGKALKQTKPSHPVVFRPGKHVIENGEELVCDETAYDVFYKCGVEWPAMSFDFICSGTDGQFSNLSTTPLRSYPLSMSLVLGTQADASSNNKLVFMRMSNLHRNRLKKSRGAGKINAKKNDSSDSESSDSEGSEYEDDGDADADDSKSPIADVDPNGVLQTAEVKADGTINRLRVMPQSSNIVAYWTEKGRVTLVDGTPALNTLYLDMQARMQAPSAIAPSSVKPFFSSRAHSTEGFALDWSRVVTGRLLSGSLDGAIFMTQKATESAATWATSPDRFRGHRKSVEDIQWSPNEPDVFASCSVDKSIRIWDVREYRRPALGIANAHNTDVNVISWNHNETHLLVSGGDEGTIKVWDLRSLQKDTNNENALSAAEFSEHQKAITSIQWHPTDNSMLCASSEDGSVTIWDFAVERDAEEEMREEAVVDGAEEFPPQLLFVHMGQKNVKDARWHPSYPSLIVSTAEDGLNVFQPSNIALPT